MKTVTTLPDDMVFNVGDRVVFHYYYDGHFLDYFIKNWK